MDDIENFLEKYPDELPKKSDIFQKILPEVVNSQALLKGRTQMTILHNDEVYYLRKTRLGKLILTK